MRLAALVTDSRLRFHGCARVIGNNEDGTANVPPLDLPLPAVPGQVQSIDARKDGKQQISPAENEKVLEYLKTHRINVNVRQVLPSGQSKID